MFKNYSRSQYNTYNSKSIVDKNEGIVKLTCHNYEVFRAAHRSAIVDKVGIIGECMDEHLPNELRTVRGIMHDFPLQAYYPKQVSWLNEFSSGDAVRELEF
jgi:hypothetical protein